MEGADALTVFCERLAALHGQSGGPPIATFSRGSQAVLGRSQTYAILAGRIGRPPSWEFVQQFVVSCQQWATRTKQPLSIPTDLAVWRRDHNLLIEAHGRRPFDAPIVSRNAAGGSLLPQQVYLFTVKNAGFATARKIGIVTGDLRDVRLADVWVNSENTDMRMARINEFCVSAIIRYGGAQRDLSGSIVEDTIFDDLERKVGMLRPVAPATAIATTSGELWRSNGVQHVVHVAAVHGEPGSGFRPIQEVGRCVSAALSVVEDLPISGVEDITVLFPLLAMGSASGSPQAIVPLLFGSALDYMTSDRATRVGTIVFLAHTDAEKAITLRALTRDPRVAKATPRPHKRNKP